MAVESMISNEQNEPEESQRKGENKGRDAKGDGGGAKVKEEWKERGTRGRRGLASKRGRGE